MPVLALNRGLTYPAVLGITMNKDIPRISGESLDSEELVKIVMI